MVDLGLVRSGLGLYQVGMSKGVVAEMLVRLLLVGSKVSLGDALIGLLDVRRLKNLRTEPGVCTPLISSISPAPNDWLAVAPGLPPGERAAAELLMDGRN